MREKRLHIKLPDGDEVELSDKQAEWIGRKNTSLIDACIGCVLFGVCVFHSSEWGKNYE